VGERAAAARSRSGGALKRWVPKLHYPIRIGEHDQTAFSFGLIWDWAGVAGDKEMRSCSPMLRVGFYVEDRRCPIDYEPSGEDFLSPCLAEADFMRRVLDAPAFGAGCRDSCRDSGRRTRPGWRRRW